MHGPYFTIIIVTGLSRRRVQLKVLQSRHYILNLSILFTNFLPQLRNKHKHQKSQISFLICSVKLLLPYLPAAISAENCCPARCTHTFWFVLAIHDREHWPSCSFPARRIHGPASHSHWFLVDSCCRGNRDDTSFYRGTAKDRNIPVAGLRHATISLSEYISQLTMTDHNSFTTNIYDSV